MLIVSACSNSEAARTEIIGTWLNLAAEADAIEFRDDGSLVIAAASDGNVSNVDRVVGTYRFLDEDNIEINLRFAEGAVWRPKWMPPGVLRNPLLRAQILFVDSKLHLRPRGQIKADHIEQFVEFGTLEFRRLPADEGPGGTSSDRDTHP